MVLFSVYIFLNSMVELHFFDNHINVTQEMNNLLELIYLFSVYVKFLTLLIKLSKLILTFCMYNLRIYHNIYIH